MPPPGQLVVLLLLCLLAVALPGAGGGSGRFWHLTDLHWDPGYEAAAAAGRPCPSGGDRTGPAGPWGSYVCDAPWSLLRSAARAMRARLAAPDFVLWTGDDTPHVPNEQLGEEKVLHIIANLTSLIKETFPGAFYSEKLPGPGMRGRMVVLNTNLYYDQNDETAGEEDPGGQFQWLEETLTNASRADEMVYIVGHVPPGFFEKKRGKPWFRRGFNERYLGIVQRHHRVIAAQFFGHHHTDSFRMFYSHTGAPINVMFLAPGVTPWKTTLPGVSNGANNPAIRVIDYDQDTLQVLDMVTYYLNLTRANTMASAEFPEWEEEYRLTEAFQVPDGSADSMQTVLERISRDPQYLQLYYELNSARYDLELCQQECRVDHLCAIREIDFTKYDECVKTNSSASAASSVWLLVFCIFLGFLSPQQVLG
ncbi:acid sphingomyelinase-like phosphodiesterase 3b isoform X2 [Camarhynchus parvulus]|uniref:Sphingomyelin phosphodiesterase acid like 3B n=1 Tax=Geospiza parvula TaxID=87175 RepID=A0A8C3MEC7_GEOPR|nr:acid sphingomyelinase-like phosphodiesterase 3b isoform X2 [Camarhynchus parvulus]